MTTTHLDLEGSRLPLRTTILLRWLAIAGQTVTVLTVAYGLGYSIRLLECLWIVALSALLNVTLSVAFPRQARLESKHAMLLLGFDIIQLAALLFLTGGLQNPFSFLLVVPVAISASTQPLSITAILAIGAVALATLLAAFHVRLPWGEGLPPLLPLPYLIGIWCSLVSCIFFIAIYAWRIGAEARQMARALTAAELVLARENKLSALDGLAAAAAHQLGTPLSTIAVIAKELEMQVEPDSPLREDVALLQTEAARCRDILGKLARSGREGEKDLIFSRMRLSHILEEVVAPLRASGVPITIKIANPPAGQQSAEPEFDRNPGLIYSLENLVENAVDFARTEVRVEAKYDPNFVLLRISDDGPGFHPTVIGRLGEPYVTTRSNARSGDEESGMGLGFFIAKTLLERSGAILRFANKPAPESGAVVEIVWPRERLEAI